MATVSKHGGSASEIARLINVNAGTATSSHVCIRPANDAGSIAAIKTAVPSFAESSVTFGAISPCLCTASKHVGTNPAVCPLALVYAVLITWERLTVVGRSWLGSKTIAHSAGPPFSYIGSFAYCRAACRQLPICFAKARTRQLSCGSLAQAGQFLLRASAFVGAAVTQRPGPSASSSSISTERDA